MAKNMGITNGFDGLLDDVPKATDKQRAEYLARVKRAQSKPRKAP